MAALPLILVAVSTAAMVAGQIQSANAASSAASYNRQVGENNAKTTEQQAQVQAQIAQRQAYITQGRALAAYGSSGIDTETGSPLDIMAQSASNAEADRQNILYNGQVKATALRNGANLAGMQGDAAATSGYLSAAGSLFAGAGKFASGYGGGAAAPAAAGSTLSAA